MAEQNPFGMPTAKLIPVLNYPGAAIPGIVFNATVPAPGAGVAIFTPVIVHAPREIVRRILVAIGTQSGNIDVGIYDRAGNRVVSLGATACPSTGSYYADIADTGLVRGFYYVACVASDGTMRFSGGGLVASIGNPASLFGVKSMAAAYPLPATATLVAPTITTGIAAALEVQ